MVYLLSVVHITGCFILRLLLFVSYYFVYYIAQVIRLVSVLTVPRLYSIEVSLDTYWAPLWYAHSTLLHIFVQSQVLKITDLSGI